MSAVAHEPLELAPHLDMGLPGEEPQNDPLLRLLMKRGDHPSAYLTMNAETQRFEVPHIDGFIAYQAAGRYAFQICGPVCREQDRRTLLSAFEASLGQRRMRLVALQLRQHDVALYQQAGFRINQLGSAYTLNLIDYSLRGGRFMKLRNKLKQARRAGVVVYEAGVAESVITTKAELEAVTAAWLQEMGRHTKLLRFMVGEVGEPGVGPRRTFVARGEDGAVVAFVTYVPAPGRLPGWMHDLSRRHPDAPNGVMELINATAIERFQAEQAPYLHFGLTPFVGLGPATDYHPERSPAVSTLLGLLHDHGAAVYPAKSQVAYKLKWRPRIVAPEYFAYRGRFRLGCLLRLLQLTKSI